METYRQSLEALASEFEENCPWQYKVEEVVSMKEDIETYINSLSRLGEESKEQAEADVRPLPVTLAVPTLNY